MPLDLPSSYSAATVEADVYRRWETAGCFKAGAGRRSGMPSYTIAIPPPNVTGVLHMGHALNNTLQDTLIRWRRMQGYDTLWQPGTDHAGIATESVVVKHIQAEGLTRDGLGREAFLKRVWAWKEQSGGAITQQLRKLGSSCDWSRERFTMDEGLSHAVRVQFTKLYDAGLIYRGTRMVNWCPVQKTALADDEVEVIEKQGFLWALKYDLADGSGSITVETTRPETFFGDTAVAVNPDDARYQHLIGKKVRLPIIGREIPIVADSYANPEKGSGAVKITPAHDPNDYELGKRHNLPLIRVIDFDGTMTKDCAQFAGLERFAARKALLKEFEASGVLLGSTEIKHAVGHSYRSNAPIEPMVTEQWFVKMDSLAKKALEFNVPGGVEFHPERWTKVYAHWLENTRDWCISRQIWWGHRIPAWRCGTCSKYTVAVTTPTACQHCAATTLAQETDVLDTWFSSALWPFSTLGWPEKTPELARYFPTSTLVTDRGIIFFWVARMVMASSFALEQKPFSDVYIHGTVLDERGIKMSKSLGNGIDPIIMIDGGTQNYLGKDYQCPGYGADAIRYTLLDMTTEGQDLKLSPAKFETGRNFANKVWNAGRFLLMNLNERPLPAAVRASDLVPSQLGFAEQWILERLAMTTEACTQALTDFRFNEYSNGAYRFFRDDLCDWYLEWAKRQFKQGGSEAADAGRVLSFCVDQVLRLLHPGMPFITEFLWQQLQGTTGGTPWSGTYLMTDAWPEPVAAHRGADIARHMSDLQAVVVAVRNARNLMQLGDGIQLAVEIHAPAAGERTLVEANREFVINRANLSALSVAASGVKPAASVSTAVGGMKIHIPVTGIADMAKLTDQLTRRAAGLEKSINGKLSRLENADFLARAPAAQVVETRDQMGKEQVELANVRETLAGL